MTPAPLSVVLITHDAGPVLERTLGAFSWAEDIVVVDSGSIDGTREIASRMGARVVLQREWRGFGHQKRFALSQANGDWVLLLDADEVADSELVEAIRHVAAGRREVAGFRIRRINYFAGVPLKHGRSRPEWMLRLFQRGLGSVSEDPVHEVVRVEGPVRSIARGALHHYSAESLADRIRKNDYYTSIIARQKHRSGERARLWHLAGVIPVSLLRDLVFRAGFLDGAPGLVAAGVDAYYAFSKYAKLWELQRRAARGEAPSWAAESTVPPAARSKDQVSGK
jgi:glycosyltransferase involved in cell wall biosynthesis